jgi:hypothetical protein
MPEAAARKIEAVEPAPEVEKPKPKPKEVVIELNTPVMAHGEMISKITFRRPTGGDIMQMEGGFPVSINWQTGVVSPNPPVMGQMMVLLAAVPPTTIRAMDAEDWSTCAHALMSFFPPGVQAMQY